MNKLKSTARRLDGFFHVLQILYAIAAVASLIGLLLIAACFVFKLDPEQIGKGFQVLDIGTLEIELAKEYVPNKYSILTIAAEELIAAIILALLGRKCLTHIRRILSPMREGLPFHETAAANLRRIALLTLIIGIVINCSRFASCYMTDYIYKLEELFLNGKIIGISINQKLDLSYLVISGVMLLLSYVFRYGHSLQQLSDETL